MKVFTKKGQSILEYAFVLVGVIAAIVGIQLYMKRGLEGRLAEATNDIGNQFRITTSTMSSADPAYPGSSAEHILTSRDATTVQLTDGDLITTGTDSSSSRQSTLYVDDYGQP